MPRGSHDWTMTGATCDCTVSATNGRRCEQLQNLGRASYPPEGNVEALKRGPVHLVAEGRAAILHRNGRETAIGHLTSGLRHTHVGGQASYDNQVDTEVTKRLVEAGGGQWPAGALDEHRLAGERGYRVVHLPARISNPGPDPLSQDGQTQLVQVAEPAREIPPVACLRAGRGVKDRQPASAEALL